MNPLLRTAHLPVTKQAEDLILLFNTCFANTENTLLVGGADEPVYQPANEECQYNQIFFTQDYFASALHEIAHWCVAGKQRRTQIDYGYWYLPDGRTVQQQKEFEAVEVKPQALERAFSMACGIKFRVSIDNLLGQETCPKAFERAVEKQLIAFVDSGFNARARQFLRALHEFYETVPLSATAIHHGVEV